MSRHVKHSSDHRTETLRRRLSHLGQIVTMKIWSSMLTAAHLDELTSGEKKIPSEDQKGPTVIAIANGKAESTEEATVYVHDLDVFVAVMLLEDSLAVLSLGLLCEGMGHPMNEKGESLHLCSKMERLQEASLRIMR